MLLFVTEFFPSSSDLKFTGGVEAYVYYLVEELSKRHQVTVICRKSSSKQKELNSKYQVFRIGPVTSRVDTEFLTVPERMIFSINAIFIGLKQDFDLVQGNNFVTYVPAFLIGFIKRKPTLAWYPDVFLGEWIKLTGIFSGIFGEVVERISLRLPWAKFVALSLSTKNKLVGNGVMSERVETIYGGVDLSLFKTIKVKREKIFTICCISRLVNYKNVDVLIKAAKKLKDKNLDFKVIIIGYGPEKNKLISLIEEKGLSKIVSIRSKISRVELITYLKSSHVFCLPSSVEGFGLVILEAVAAGLPYVVSDIPVLREVTRNGQGGLFFKEKDPSDLAEKISRLIGDKILVKKLEKDGQKLLKWYSWDKIAKQFEEEYLKLKKKPRILMLIDAWFPHIGGGQVHVWELSKQLVLLGYNVTIFTRNQGKWDETFDGIEVKRVGIIKKFDNIIGRLEYLFRALVYSLFTKYDLWHAHAFSPGLLTPFVKLLRNKPTVFTAHGEGWKIAGLGLGGGFLQDLVFYKLPYDVEITVAKNTFKKKTAAKRVDLIPNGVTVDKFNKAQRRRTNIKRLIFFGRLFKDKGVHLLIEAFKDLKGDFSLAIVGDGPEIGNLKKQAKGLKVRFTGQLEGMELVKEINKGDLFVMPSLVEGMPIRLLEAWSAKLPVLATRVGDNEVYINDGINGFLCETTTDSIKDNLERVLKNKNLKRIAEQGFKDVQKYAWVNIAKKTSFAYREVLNEKSKS